MAQVSEDMQNVPDEKCTVGRRMFWKRLEAEDCTRSVILTEQPTEATLDPN